MTIPTGVPSTDDQVVITTNTNPVNGAQSPNPSPAAFQHGANGEKTFSADDLQKARQQEKDKLYSELSNYKDQIATIQKQLDAQQAQRDEELSDKIRQAQEKEAKAKKKAEDEMSAKALLEQKLRETNDSWEERFSNLQNERAQERAILDKERRYNELVEYRNSKLNEFADDIAPEFHAFISGENEDQINSAIEKAKAATQSIADQAKIAQQKMMSQMRGVSATGYGPMGPMESSIGEERYSAADINNMNMEQYAAFREKTGIASGQAFRNRGLFG